MVVELFLAVCNQEGQENLGDAGCQRRVDLDANDTRMSIQWQDDPVSEIFIECNECLACTAGSIQYYCIVRPGLTDFAGTSHFMPTFAEQCPEVGMKHLIKIESHSWIKTFAGGRSRYVQ